MRAGIVALFVVCFVSTAFAEDAPTVALKSIVEKREVTLVKGPFAGWNNNIEIALHIDGPAVQGARKYGHLKITKATDDAGTDLTKQGSGPKFSSDSFDEIREPMTFGFGEKNKPKPTGFDYDLKLPSPSARSAKKIASISATLDVLVGGQKKIIEVKPLKQSLGKAIDDPALKEMGVGFELIDPSKPTAGGVLSAVVRGKGGKSVSAVISGNIDALASVNIVNAAGKKLSHGSWSSESGGKRSITYELEEALPDDAALQLEVWPGQKTVTVPIELKDIALP